MMVVEFHSVTGKSIIHEYIGDFPKGASAWAEEREGGTSKFLSKYSRTGYFYFSHTILDALCYLTL